MVWATLKFVVFRTRRRDLGGVKIQPTRGNSGSPAAEMMDYDTNCVENADGAMKTEIHRLSSQKEAHGRTFASGEHGG